MNKLSNLFLSSISILVISANVNANKVPSDTKRYVDQQVQALDKKLQSQINSIPPSIKYKAGEGINISDDHIISTTKPKELHVGDYYQGGIIFWLDPLQDYQHGLIVDVTDMPGTYMWDSSGTTSYQATNATESGAYAGKSNTAKIVAILGDQAQAATACTNSSHGGYNDWYLPSPLEAITMLKNEMTINIVVRKNNGKDISWASYWTSMEMIGSANNESVWVVHPGADRAGGRKNETSRKVRCIRAF